MDGAGGAFSQRWLTQQASGKAGNPGGRVPVSQMRSPRPQEGRWLPQGHPCSQQMMRPTPLCLLLPGKQASPSCGSRAWLFVPREGETLGTPLHSPSLPSFLTISVPRVEATVGIAPGHPDVPRQLGV